ncbi:polysaccharide biosynthesis/export family protein, partial [Klebsiella pneumoniae]|nr:polysaccharide biosynthesis/export family protein [Klebsiella pneumoniae]
MSRLTSLLAAALLFAPTLLLPVTGAPKSTSDADSKSDAPAVTDPSYRLSTGDTIAIAVFNEPDLAATQTIAR